MNYDQFIIFKYDEVNQIDQDENVNINFKVIKINLKVTIPKN